VPVVTSDVPSLKKLFERYPKAGVCVSSIEKIVEDAPRLIGSGDEGRKAAAECFDREFSFDGAFERFLDRFRRIVGE